MAGEDMMAWLTLVTTNTTVLITVKMNSLTSKDITLMALKPFGAILNEESLCSMVYVKLTLSYFLKNVSGGTIGVMKYWKQNSSAYWQIITSNKRKDCLGRVC